MLHHDINKESNRLKCGYFLGVFVEVSHHGSFLVYPCLSRIIPVHSCLINTKKARFKAGCLGALIA